MKREELSEAIGEGILMGFNKITKLFLIALVIALIIFYSFNWYHDSRYKKQCEENPESCVYTAQSLPIIKDSYLECYGNIGKRVEFKTFEDYEIFLRLENFTTEDLECEQRYR